MATCGRLRSNIAGNPCTARSFSIQRMVCNGRLGAVVLPSHGRGPRFDPLCAHHPGLQTLTPLRSAPSEHGGTMVDYACNMLLRVETSSDLAEVFSVSSPTVHRTLGRLRRE